MNVPGCGCVSQPERLTNCSFLLNVRVMEAINGFELIAVTHLAPCHHAPPFTTCPEDSGVMQMFGFRSVVWCEDDEQPMNHGDTEKLMINFVDLQQLDLLSMLAFSIFLLE